jgi:AhpD family alkylhydroperoxidase
MLAVTAVNRCRYCSYFHTGEALKSGLSQKEISRLLSGEVTACPPEEASAVIFAQHWAESNAHPDPIIVQKLQEKYGQKKAGAIQLVLRMIRVGNLSGNSWDYLLYRLSFGNWGQ